MLNSFRFLLILLFVPMLASTLRAQNFPKIRIDPSLAYGGLVSEYLSEVEYIPLETTKESLFGDVTQLIITNESFIIQDWDTKKILFFDLKGKYITNVRESQTSQLNIGCDLDKQILNVSVYDIHTRTSVLKQFTFTGKALSSKPKKIKSDEVIELVSLGKGFYAKQGNCYLKPNDKPLDSIYNLITIYSDDAPYKSFFPYNQHQSPGICLLKGYLEKINIVQNGSFYLSTPLEHAVFRVNKDTAIKMFQFIFPANRIISEKIYLSKNMQILDSTRKAIDNDQNLILDVSNIFFNKSKLFFKVNTRVYIMQQGSDMSTQYNFIYDTLTSKLTSLERLTPDSTNSYLPILGNNTRVSGLAYHNEYFYSCLSSLKIFATKEATKSRNPQYPPVLQEYFRTQTRKSNPVIVRMKLKE